MADSYDSIHEACEDFSTFLNEFFWGSMFNTDNSLARNLVYAKELLKYLAVILNVSVQR